MTTVKEKGRTQDTKSAGKVLAVLDVLLRNFAHGFTSSELQKETGSSASDMTRYTATLEKAGYAERIPETGRWRPSHRMAQHAVQILASLDSAQQRITEAKNRLYLGNEAQVNHNKERLTNG
jgi:DNA-binding IclR family transcriptional regulator